MPTDRHTRYVAEMCTEMENMFHGCADMKNSSVNHGCIVEGTTVNYVWIYPKNIIHLLTNVKLFLNLPDEEHLHQRKTTLH